jgi:hypothetical protein
VEAVDYLLQYFTALGAKTGIFPAVYLPKGVLLEKDSYWDSCPILGWRETMEEGLNGTLTNGKSVK